MPPLLPLEFFPRLRDVPRTPGSADRNIETANGGLLFERQLVQHQWLRQFAVWRNMVAGYDIGPTG